MCTVSTPYGEIRIKIGSRAGETLNAAPEFEDCRKAAALHSVPVKLVQQAAIARLHATSSKGGQPVMTPSSLLKLLGEVERGALTPEAAAERLATLPFEDLGHSRVDHHRSLRAGLPEVVFAAGKTAAQTVDIVSSLAASGVDVLVTRARHRHGRSCAREASSCHS